MATPLIKSKYKIAKTMKVLWLFLCILAAAMAELRGSSHESTALAVDRQTLKAHAHYNKMRRTVKRNTKSGKRSKASSKSKSKSNDCPAPGSTHFFGRPLFQYNSTSNDKHVGIAVSASSNGKRVATLNQLVDNSAIVQVWHETIDGKWEQLGEDIPVFGRLGKEWWNFPNSMMALDGSGSTLVVASPFSDSTTGRVDIYEYKTVTGWSPHHLGPITSIESPRFHMPVGVAAGGYLFAFGTDAGYARVYISLGSWNQIDNDLVPEDPDTMKDFGRDLAVAPGGNVVAVSYHKILEDGTVKGRTRFYRFYMNTWLPMGDDIQDTGDLSLSYDGRTALIDRTIYNYNDDTEEWTGTLLKEWNGRQWKGSISHDGKRAVIADIGRLTNTGRIEIFDYVNGHWCKIRQRLGRQEFVNFGYSLSLAADGTRLAVSAPYKQYYYKDSYMEVYAIREHTDF